MKAAHVLRRSDGTSRALVKRARAAVPVAREYPAGFFLELVRLHNWPPSFEPHVRSDARRLPPPDEVRAAGGFDREALNLPGAVEHLKRWRAEKAPKA